jgi:hypothetical protein
MKLQDTIFIALIFLFIFSGCVVNSKFGYYQINEIIALQDENAGVIAADMERFIKKNFGPGETKFIFIPSQKTFLSTALETNLRNAGYAISSDPGDRAGVKLAYLIDSFDETHIVVRLVAGDVQVNRLYEKGNDGWNATYSTGRVQ